MKPHMPTARMTLLIDPEIPSCNGEMWNHALLALLVALLVTPDSVVKIAVATATRKAAGFCSSS